jgi:hypothetical protein
VRLYFVGLKEMVLYQMIAHLVWEMRGLKFESDLGNMSCAWPRNQNFKKVSLTRNPGQVKLDSDWWKLLKNLLE